jgi:hypothetical protein
MLQVHKPPLPEGFEYLVFPHWSLLGGSYTDAIEVALQKLREEGREWDNRLAGKRSQGNCLAHIFETEEKSSALQMVRAAQNGCQLLVVSGQTGGKYRGKSIEDAQKAMKTTGQVGLGLFEVLISLLTHPGAMRHLDDLQIDCPGDRVRWEILGMNGEESRWGQGVYAPHIGFRSSLGTPGDGEWLEIDAYRIDTPRETNGSASMIRT